MRLKPMVSLIQGQSSMFLPLGGGVRDRRSITRLRVKKKIFHFPFQIFLRLGALGSAQSKRLNSQHLFLTNSKLVNGRRWIIGFPVEPIIVQQRQLLELASAQWTADRPAGEVPLAAGLCVDEPQLSGRLGEELQRAAFAQPLKSTHRLLIVTKNYSNRNSGNVIKYGTLFEQRVEGIRSRCVL